ncbi:ATP-binding cassette domain-containing protein, partial [Lysinibacillus fusiformis]|uniref:ATP-binding cassette domain-containing protein n=1 Tax=Lysinibacillus fusiformis TaxID=28031 RepID=UPI00201C161E
MKDFILKIENLNKSFKGQKIVDNVSLEIQRTTVYGLLGPNGAGKSTTLKMMTGMLRPNAGNIIFNGHTWTRNDLQEIGVLIETPPIYSNLTA